jgi:sugar phosphate isomerase/epimerase
MKTLSRRQFVAGLSIAATALATSNITAADAKQRYKVIGFIKPFQELGNIETADAIAQIGWDGIECPVRANGRITAENAADELPKLIEALKKVGADITLITTDILNPKQPEAEPLLRLAARLGIKRYRLGFFKYSTEKSIPDQLKENTAALRDLAALNKEIGITGGIQNHSGADYFGAPVWDIWSAIKELDPKYLGSYFDIAHATKEGGSSWPIETRLMEPYFNTISVKDFIWEKSSKGATAKWVPLGQGFVDPKFFKWLKTTKFNGPISHHVEFPVGEGKERIAKIKADAQVLRQWLAA